jgi:hypothetical protein
MPIWGPDRTPIDTLQVLQSSQFDLVVVRQPSAPPAKSASHASVFEPLTRFDTGQRSR